jgi:hypothetical protein
MTIGGDTPLGERPIFWRVPEHWRPNLRHGVPSLLSFRGIGDLPVRRVHDQRRAASRRDFAFRGLQPDPIQLTADRHLTGERREQPIDTQLGDR